MRRAVVDYVVPAAFYLACFVVMTWPAVRSFSIAYLFGSEDGLQNAWNLWWVDKSLTELHRSPFHTTYLHAPAGTTLLGHTLNPFNGLLAIPLSRVFSPAATYNAIVVCSFVVCGWTTYALARAVGASRGGALLAGFLFTFCAFHFAHATSHLQLVALEWVPLCLLCVLRLMTKPTIGRALATAGAVLLVVLCDYYYLLYCVIAGLLLYVLMAWATRDALLGLRRPYLVPLLVFVAASLGTTGLLVGAVMVTDHRDPFFGAHSSTIYYADLLAPFIPGGSWAFHGLTEQYWSVFPAGWVEMSVYIGWGAIVLAIIGWRRRDRSAASTLPLAWWPLIAAVFFILALGPSLRVWGFDTKVPMPYALLERLVPIFKLSGLPVRMMVMVSLAVSVLAACGWTALARSPASPRRKLALAALLVFIAFEIWPRPLPLTSQPVPAWVYAMQKLPTGSIIDVHTHPAHAMYYQTIHEKPYGFGYVSREPASVATEKLRKQLAAETRDVAALRREWGFDYFVTPSTIDVPAAAELLYDDGQTRIYSLRPRP
jgi:hypothetical protein